MLFSSRFRCLRSSRLCGILWVLAGNLLRLTHTCRGSARLGSWTAGTATYGQTQSLAFYRAVSVRMPPTFVPSAFMACVPFGIVGYSWCLKPQTLFMPHCAVGMRPVGAVFTRTCAAFTGGFLLFVLGSKEKGLPLGVDCGLLWMCSGQKLPRGSTQLRHSGIGEWRSSLVVLRHHSETGARPPPMGPPTLENPGTIF